MALPRHEKPLLTDGSVQVLLFLLYVYQKMGEPIDVTGVSLGIWNHAAYGFSQDTCVKLDWAYPRSV